MAFNTNQAIVAEYYVAVLGRLPEQAGFDYWVGQLDAGMTPESLMGLFFDDSFPEVAARYPATQTNEEAIESFYLNVFGRPSDPGGLAFWTAKLDGGDSKAAVMAEMLAVAKDPANAIDGAYLLAQQALAEAALEHGVVDPGNPGSNYYLTGTQDLFVDANAGGADNDTYIADAGANINGVIVNALQTGDRIDGGAGIDTLEATIIADTAIEDNAIAVRPVLENIEKVHINALDFDDTYSGDVNDLVRLNVDEVDGNMDEIWSDGSEASLRVENVANDGDTKDITIGMRSTGNHGSLNRREESNYEVYFEEIELTAGSSGEGGFFFDLINQEAYDISAAEAVKDFPLSGLSFDVSFGGATAENFLLSVTTAELVGIHNHTQLSALLNAKVNALGDSRLDSFTFEVVGSFSDGDGRANIDRIQLTNSDPLNSAVSNGVIHLDTSSGAGNLYWNQGPLVNVITDEPITATVILDDVGRDSDGGYLRVGSMSEDIGDTNHGSTGIEVFDLTVQRDSSLSGLYTTNNTLDQILIKSGAGFSGDLEIGNTNTALVSGETMFEAGLDLIRATNFNGDLTIGTSSGTRAINVETLDAQIAGDVSFLAELTQNDATDADTSYNYMTGAGSDTINVMIDGDAVDSEAEGLAISAGAGDNSVTVQLDTGVSPSTMALLSNLDITTGSGADTVTNMGIGLFEINTGAGSDTVWIKSDSAEGIADDILNDNLIGNSLDGEAGHWEISTATGDPTFATRVLYEAELTVSFAGIEESVMVQTDGSGNFIATQMTINNAIKAAIDANSELSRLLDYTDTTGNEQMIITSTFDGENPLFIDLFQPTVVATGATAGQVNFNSSHLPAMQNGLVMTGVAADSNAADTVGEIVTLMATIDGFLDAAGAAGVLGVASENSLHAIMDGGSGDETTASSINSSIINLGDGANDLVMLNSLEAGDNTIVFEGTFGKNTIVNFFTDGTDVGTVGTHILDFTSYLTNETSASGSPLSNVDIARAFDGVATGVAAGSALTENEVHITTGFAATAADTWDGMSGAAILTAINGGALYGNLGDAVNSSVDVANLVGTVQHNILLIENSLNLGEYKVVHLTADDDTTVTNFTTATIVGTVDFGASITNAAILA